jgi:O-antigen/teichoic acid export membrane protein
MGIAKAVEAASDVVYGVLQQGERMDLIAGSLFMRGLAGAVGLAVGLATTRSVAIGVINMAAGWAAVFLFYDLPRASRILKARAVPEQLAPRWTARTLRSMFWLALPLGIVMTMGSLMSSIPCILIEKFRGAAELGIYTALAYSQAASHRIASAMGEAASARLARHHAVGDRAAFIRIMGVLFCIVAMGGAAGLAIAGFAGGPVLSFLYGPEYARHADLFAGLMLVAGVAALANILDYGLTAMRRLRIQPLLYGGAMLVYAALCVRMIPSRGLGGAILALGIVSLLQAFCTLGILAQVLLGRPGVGGTSRPRNDDGFSSSFVEPGIPQLRK